MIRASVRIARRLCERAACNAALRKSEQALSRGRHAARSASTSPRGAHAVREGLLEDRIARQVGVREVQAAARRGQRAQRRAAAHARHAARHRVAVARQVDARAACAGRSGCAPRQLGRTRLRHALPGVGEQRRARCAASLPQRAVPRSAPSGPACGSQALVDRIDIAEAARCRRSRCPSAAPRRARSASGARRCRLATSQGA